MWWFILLITDAVKPLSALEENANADSHENKGKEKPRTMSNKYSAARSPKTMRYVHMIVVRQI